MSGLILGAKVRHRLGDLELETANTELELLGAAMNGQKGPNGWDLSALAVAVASSRELKQAREQIESLTAIVTGLARVASAAGYPCDLKSLIELGTRQDDPDDFDPPADPAAAAAAAALKPGGLRVVASYEPASEELQADYERRVSSVRSHAFARDGWAALCHAALAPRSPSQMLSEGRRPPSPAELAELELWLDRNPIDSPGGEN